MVAHALETTVRAWLDAAMAAGWTPYQLERLAGLSRDALRGYQQKFDISLGQVALIERLIPANWSPGSPVGLGQPVSRGRPRKGNGNGGKS